ncbi:MAG: murein L,D-transpeptidase catalytic domain family protein [Bdellovibrionales bacterium]|nr:murein L,D-transpeptidase catalytic domain family protein [Bdellovibrionales bacterium]
MGAFKEIRNFSMIICLIIMTGFNAFADEISADLLSKSLELHQTYESDSKTIAIIDLRKPSTEKRLWVVDVDAQTVVLNTLVAHGRNSGGNYATSFSNTDGSHQTSLGMYKVLGLHMSPKHGRSLLLEGLDQGLNHRARAREIIMHGAWYVSDAFIKAHGRLGRSFGCPSVPKDEIEPMIRLLPKGSLLYIYHAQLDEISTNLP